MRDLLAKTPLHPRVNSMTIRTEQSEVSFIGEPVFDSASPRIASAMRRLFLGIDVVDVERTNIVESTFDASTAEFLDQCELDLPCPRLFVGDAAVFVPVRALTITRAKSNITRFIAVKTLLIIREAVSHVARLVTEFSRTVSHAIRRKHFRFPAMKTFNFYRFFSHPILISKYVDCVKPMHWSFT